MPKGKQIQNGDLHLSQPGTMLPSQQTVLQVLFRPHEYVPPNSLFSAIKFYVIDNIKCNVDI